MEIEFRLLEENELKNLIDYFKTTWIKISDYSLAFKLMWQSYYELEYAIVNDCLVFKEEYEGKIYFHYPMSKSADEIAELGAIRALESYAIHCHFKLNFTNVPKERLALVVERYGLNVRVKNIRKWRDYLYNAEDFKNYAGKVFSGQRNHVNKFKKLYPNHCYLSGAEVGNQKMIEFLGEFKERALSKGSQIAEEEFIGTTKLLEHVQDYNFLVGAIELEGRIIAMSIGEVCGNQLIVHIEKALVGYEGVYPTMAQYFAKSFANGKVVYINRQDDAGDRGLRKSKLQYNPCCIVDKFDVFPERVIDSMESIPTIYCPRLILGEITSKHLSSLFALEMERERNRLWGYDWTSDIKNPTPEYFLDSLQSDFKERDEVPIGIFLEDELIGEVVYHNFDYVNCCEVGVRLMPSFEGKGYAKEAVSCAIDYALYNLDMDCVYAKCFIENERSLALLKACGMVLLGKDEEYFYFKKTAKH